MTNLRPWLAALLGMIASAASHGLAGASAMTGEIVVVKEPVNGDLFAAGRTVSIQSVINGDLTVAGANVAFEERVEGYLMAAGSNIEVNGPVRNDLWAAGASIEINAPIGDNAPAAEKAANGLIHLRDDLDDPFPSAFGQVFCQSVHGAIEAPREKEEVNENESHRKDQVSRSAEYGGYKSEGLAGGFEYSGKYLLGIDLILPYHRLQLTHIDTVRRSQRVQVIRQPISQVSYLRDEKRSAPCKQSRTTQHHDSQQDADRQRPRTAPLTLEISDQWVEDVGQNERHQQGNENTPSA